MHFHEKGFASQQTQHHRTLPFTFLEVYFIIKIKKNKVVIPCGKNFTLILPHSTLAITNYTHSSFPIGTRSCFSLRTFHLLIVRTKSWNGSITSVGGPSESTSSRRIRAVSLLNFCPVSPGPVRKTPSAALPVSTSGRADG